MRAIMDVGLSCGVCGYHMSRERNGDEFTVECVHRDCQERGIKYRNPRLRVNLEPQETWRHELRVEYGFGGIPRLDSDNAAERRLAAMPIKVWAS